MRESNASRSMMKLCLHRLVVTSISSLYNAPNTSILAERVCKMVAKKDKSFAKGSAQGLQRAVSLRAEQAGEKNTLTRSGSSLHVASETECCSKEGRRMSVSVPIKIKKSDAVREPSLSRISVQSRIVTLSYRCKKSP